jgi:hypothetical protein
MVLLYALEYLKVDYFAVTTFGSWAMSTMEEVSDLEI